MKYNVEEVLQDVMNRVAEEIRLNGKESLYKEGQTVCGGKITIDISCDYIPTVTYERVVIPDRLEKSL